MAEYVNVRLPRELHIECEAEAKRRGASVSQVVREAVAEHLASETGRRYDATIEMACDRALTRHVDRLAALLAKAIIAAERGARLGELTYGVLETVHGDDIQMPTQDEAIEESERLAVGYLRRSRTARHLPAADDEDGDH